MDDLSINPHPPANQQSAPARASLPSASCQWACGGLWAGCQLGCPIVLTPVCKASPYDWTAASCLEPSPLSLPELNSSCASHWIEHCALGKKIIITFSYLSRNCANRFLHLLSHWVLKTRLRCTYYYWHFINKQRLTLFNNLLKMTGYYLFE